MVEISLQDLDDLMWTSLRYGLGRKTYIVGVISDLICKYVDHLNKQNRLQMAKEIRIAVQTGRAGMDMDVACWLKAANCLEGEIK